MANILKKKFEKSVSAPHAGGYKRKNQFFNIYILNTKDKKNEEFNILKQIEK